MGTALFAGATFTTLYFNSAIQDPFNSPKFWIIMLLAGWVLSGIAITIKTNPYLFAKHKLAVILISTFAILQILIMSMSTNKLKAIMGETQRRNGAFSYVALAIIMLAMIIYGDLQNLRKLNYYFIFISFIFVIYGLLQINGNDFVKWNNPYNAIILTLGNPNFSGAAMAILASFSFGQIFVNNLSLFLRVLHSIISILLVFTIYLSNARQGLMAFAVGLLTISVILSFTKSRLKGYTALALAVALSVFSIFGMLQRGPLTEILYKSSVTVRGYYWTAGIEMFKDHFWTGVGLDNYGDYFKVYRDSKYPQLYGFETTSSNAHNVFIQFFSTGGFVLGLFYLLICSLIFSSTVLTLKRSSNKRKLEIAPFFAAWLAFQATSVISIDNIGVSIWGWILGGALIAFQKLDIQNSEKLNKIKRNSTESLQPLLGLIFILPIFVLVSMLFKVETAVFQSRVIASVSSENFSDQAKTRLINNSQLKFLDSNYRVNIASYLANMGNSKDAISVLNKTLLENPRNQDAYSLMAFIKERTGDIDTAIILRKKIAELDPWDANNYLSLGQLYKSLGEDQVANDYFKKILTFARDSKPGIEALKNLQG